VDGRDDRRDKVAKVLSRRESDLQRRLRESDRGPLVGRKRNEREGHAEFTIALV
jgi:hypothetical protein